MLQLGIIIAYFAAVIVIGLTSIKKRWRLDEYLVAGRKYSTFFIAGSLLATIIGGSATIGLAGLGFSRGLSGAWWLLVGVLGLIILGFFFAKKVRNYGLFTLPELITRQYDRRAGTAASILIVVAWIGVTAGQILAAGKILGALGIGTPVLWMILFSLIFIGYTLLGGQYAIVRTDILDIVIIFGGILLGVGVMLSQTGGFSGLFHALPADKLAFPLSSKFGLTDLFSYLLLVGLTYVVGPDMYARLFCAKDGQTARKATFWAAGLLVPFAFCITLIGMGAFYFFPQISPEAAFPSLITRHTAGLGGRHCFGGFGLRRNVQRQRHFVECQHNPLGQFDQAISEKRGRQQNTAPFSLGNVLDRNSRITGGSGTKRCHIGLAIRLHNLHLRSNFAGHPGFLQNTTQADRQRCSGRHRGRRTDRIGQQTGPYNRQAGSGWTGRLPGFIVRSQLS